MKSLHWHFSSPIQLLDESHHEVVEGLEDPRHALYLYVEAVIKVWRAFTWRSPCCCRASGA